MTGFFQVLSLHSDQNPSGANSRGVIFVYAPQFLSLFQPQLTTNLVIIFPYRVPVCPHRLGDGALAGNLRMLPHIGGDGFLLLADPVWDSLQVSALLDGPDLRFHLLNQSRQESLTLLPGLGVHIPGVLLAVRPNRRVAALPAVFADFGDTPGAGLSDLAVVGNEGDE